MSTELEQLQTEQTGASVRAANWVRVGETCGRGRGDRTHAAPETRKAVYMYALEPAWRARLAAPAPAVAPLAVGDGLDAESWAGHEFGEARLGDARLSARLVQSAQHMAESPMRAITGAAHGARALVKGHYRLIDQPADSAVTVDNILAPHRERTLRRMQAHDTVLCIQDGTRLNFTRRGQTQGLGAIGSNQTGAVARGLELHTTLAVNPDGVALGVLRAAFDAPALPNPDEEDQPKPREERKSFRWIEGLRDCAQAAEQLPETRVVCAMDREADFLDYEADETFTVRLSSPAGATIGDGDGTGEGTITNDDAAPEVFIENDATVDEGDPAPFVVKLSAQSVLPVRVPVATMDGTAVAGSDYTAIDRTLTFQPGTDSLTVDVSTRDDNADEPETETFTLALSAPDGATLRNNQSTGTGTIRDNDDLPDTGRTTAGCGATKRPGSSNDRNTVTRRETTPDRPPRAGRDPPMTNDQAVPREQIDAEIERIRTVLREYPWYIGRSGRIRATLLEETDDKTEETVCPIAMLSMHASDQQIETVLANPAHRQWAERVEETVPTDVAEHVERIAEENDSAPLTDRNELRRYAAALLINDEPVSAPAAELVGLERETIRRLADAADDTSTPLVLRHD